MISRMSRSNRNLIRRQRKLTILLDGAGNRVVNSSSRKESLAEYDPSIFVSTCKGNWATWLTQVQTERERILGTVRQYPLAEDVKELMDLERFLVKMEQVMSHNRISTHSLLLR